MADSLKKLDKSKINWEVIARISRLWDCTNVHKNNELMSIDMLLLDAEGTQIHGKIRKRQAEMFRSKIKEGDIYLIKNFMVADSENAYKPVEGEITIIFLPVSSFKEVSSYDGPPIEMHKFHFQQKEVILERLGNHTCLTDVAGLLLKMGEIEDRLINGSLVNTLELEIEITRNFKLKTTLWAEKARHLEELMKKQSQGPFVVIITSTMVKKLFGEVCLSSSAATKMHVNLDVPETKRLPHNADIKHTFISVMDSKKKYNLTLDEQKNENRKSINELAMMIPTKETNNSVVVTIMARVREVQKRYGWCYNSCENCKRKLQHKGNLFHCNECKQDSVFPNTSFKVELLVVDETGETTLAMFDKEVQNIIGVSAMSLMSHYGASIRDLPPQLNNFIGRQFIFQLRLTDYNLIYGHQEYTITKVYNVEAKGKEVKRINGIKIEDIDFDTSQVNSRQDEKKNCEVNSDADVVVPSEKTKNKLRRAATNNDYNILQDDSDNSQQNDEESRSEQAPIKDANLLNKRHSKRSKINLD